MQVSIWQKALSYFTPVRLWKGSSPLNPVLELLLYQGRFQLATEDALYSDGDRYRPLVAGLGAMRSRLEKIQTVLVLGAGLGSAVDVLRRFGARPQITLVELDETVGRWARELLRDEARSRVRVVVDDAQDFISHDGERYDLLIVDVFSGRAPLPFVTQKNFLSACRHRILPGGAFILNYMLNAGGPPWDETFAGITAVFGGARTLTLGPNRVVVWEAEARQG